MLFRTMLFRQIKKQKSINTTEIVDEIENSVYSHLKPYGFRKFGRTLHRFVSEDISQVINFQSGLPTNGMSGLLCVNLGIRVPECAEKSFHISSEKKKYYHEYDCNIRSRLGTVSGKKETWYDLRNSTKKIIESIQKEIDETVLPVFGVLNSRDAILSHRREYPLFDTLNSHLILLEESMIYGHLGDTEKAKELFEAYYQSAVSEYEDQMKNGRQQYLKKGERVIFMGQDITAEKDGWVTLYGASHKHIEYLDQLAKDLNLR